MIVVYKPLVAYVDRRSQAFGGSRGRLQAFGGIRGSSFTSLWWQTWIVIHKPLVAEVIVYKPLMAHWDRRSQAFSGRWSRLEAFGGIRGSSFTSIYCQMDSFRSLWWHTWIVVYKPLVTYVDYRTFLPCELATLMCLKRRYNGQGWPKRYVAAKESTLISRHSNNVQHV